MTGHRPSDGFIKSSFSEGGGNCVEVRRRQDEQAVYIRDSKYRRDGRNRLDLEPIIEMPAAAWDTFEALVLRRTVVEQFPGTPDIEYIVDGTVLRGADGTTLKFTSGEWDAFRAGLAEAEFYPRSAAA